MTEREKGYEVVMPKLGLIMTEALLVEWHVKDGEWIDKGSTLFSLESEKTIIDIEAPASGYVQILANVDETVPVMTPVAIISPDPGKQLVSRGGTDGAEKPKSASGSSTKSVSRAAPPISGGVKISPKARQLAKSRDIDLAGVQGTGVRGMIVSADLDNLPTVSTGIKASPVARNMAADLGLNLERVTGTGRNGIITRADVSRTVRNLLAEIDQPSAQPDPAEHLSGFRSVIARRLTESWNQRPHVTLNAHINAEALVSDREQRKNTGNKISYNTYLIKASALALAACPDLNVQLTADALVRLEQVNIGLAVDTERGLMVPVLKNADTRSIQDLDQELLDLVERSLSGKLLPEEYSGGSFTVTNLGAFGVDSFTPIINPPESAILGVGRIVDQPVVDGDALRPGKRLTLSLSFDHRVIDGAPAAQFLAHIVDILQDPAQLETF